jgi:hypothetical protein
MPYYQSKKCLKKCPEGTYYSSLDSKNCINICDTKYIDYEENKCVFSCSSGKIIGEKKENNVNLYCLNKCYKDFGEFFDGIKCQQNCSKNFQITDLTDPENKKCVCKFLYFIVDGDINCLDPEITECPKESKYKYRIYKSNQCTDICLGFRPPDGDICFQGAKTCDEIDIKYTAPNGIKSICDCKYRNYINSEGKKVCIKEDKCSLLSYQYYIPEKKECFPFCSSRYNGIFSKIFENNCYKSCEQINMSDSPESNECKCTGNKFWIRTGGSENIGYKCIDNCNKEFPYLIPETNQCVKNCTGTKYEVFYKNKCYSSCPLIIILHL